MKKLYTIVFLTLFALIQVQGQICDNYTDGGRVFQNIDTATIAYCNALSLLPMTEVIAPSGGSGGSPIYQWQVSFNLGNSWVDIAISEGGQRDLFANSNPVLNYLIGIGLDANQTTIFRRAVRRSNCPNFVFSNGVIFKVYHQITDPGHFRNLITQCEINGNNFCTPAISPQQLDQYIDPALPYLPSGGTAPYEYRWEISEDDFNWSYYSSEALPDLCFAPGVRRFFRRGVRPVGSPCNFLYSNSIEIRNVRELVIDFNITHPECSDESSGIIEVYDLSGNDNFILNTFQYSIDNGQSWQPSNIFSNLPSGDYTITIDSKCACDNPSTSECVGNASIVSTPAPIINSVIHSDLTDCGADDGTITITASGGLSPLKYSIDGFTWSSNPNFTDLPLGTYFIFVKNTDDSCERYYGQIELIEPPTPFITQVSTVDLTDCDSGDGSLTITAAGDFGNFEYSIDNGISWSTNPTFTNLDKTVYTVGVRNNDGTCPVFQNVNIDGPSAPIITNITPQQPSNCNINDGLINVTATPGTGQVFFSIDGGNLWQTSGSFSELAPGTYSIAVRNANGTCIIFEPNPVQLDYPPAPSILSVDSSQPTDCNVDDGTIAITATDGIGAFEFSINGGSSWQPSDIFSGLPPGTYSIAVRNANGTCITLEPNPVQLDYPPAPSIVSVGSSQPTDCDVDDGTISITAADGIGSFEFSINGGSSWQSSGTFSGLPPGAYSIAVRNANGTCSSLETNPVQLDYPPAPSIVSVNSSQPTDCDIDNGMITITATDGIGSFDFSIDGGSSWQASGNFTGLPPGTYSIAVRNANGTCLIFEPNPVQLNYPPAPSIVSVDSSQPTDCDVDDGMIIISATDGIGSFDFSIDGGSSWQSSGSFSGLSPGTYSIAVRNANGTCIILEPNPVQLDYPPAPSILSVESSQPTDCNLNDGTITINATDGIDSFEFSINGGSSWQSSGSFSGLWPGTYSIAVRNANGTCIILEPNPVQLDYPPAPSILSVESSQPTDCNLNDGTITINATDGIDSFEFSINGGSSWQNSGSFSDLSPGAYSIAVRNANGTCITLEPNPVQLDYPPFPSIVSVDFSQPSDCDVDDGTISITATDGIGSFEFSINGGSSWQASGNFTGLPPGTYSIAVRNANGTCLIFEPNPVQLDYPPFPSIVSVDFSQPSDCDVDDGTISITAADGIGSFELSIDGGSSWQTSGSFTGLQPGTYSIAIRNANGTCIILESNPVQLDYPPAPSIVSVDSSQPTDCDVDDGMIIISATDGIGSFEFSINGGSSWQSSGAFSGLPPGAYYIAVRNANGTCIIFEPNPVQLDYPPAPSIVSVNSSQPTDCDIDDGMIIISATDGIGAFDFSIDGGSSWQSQGTFSALPPGTYSVAVRNANGTCLIFEPNPVQLDYPPAPSIVSVNSSQPTDCDIDDGMITITATDGIGSFEFSIDGGSSWQNSGSFSDLPPGTYSIAVRNANGTCIIFEPNPVQLDYPPAPSILSVDSSQPTDCGVDDGTISITATDGIGSFEFSINGGNSWLPTGTFSGLSPGTYSVAVRNANGTCSSLETNPVQLDYPPVPSIVSVNSSQPTDCDVDDGTISITATDGISSFEFSINGGNSWQSSGAFSGLPPGAYYIAVRNANGTCSSLETNPVQLDYPPAPSIVSVDNSQPTNCDVDDGTIAITAADGIGAFDFSIDGGSSWQSSGSFSGLSPGTYSIAVRNANGTCIILEPNPVQLDYPPAPSILSVDSSQPTDCDVDDGSISITATDGIGSFEFSIDGGNSWLPTGTFSGLSPGTYSVAVRNANGTCLIFEPNPVQLNYPPAPSIVSVDSSQPTDCDVDDGMIIISATDGIGSFDFSIDGGSSWQASGNFTGLPPGTYSIAVRNANGTCLIFEPNPVQLDYPPFPSIVSVDFSQPSDCDVDDGTISITAADGIGSFELSIDGGSSWQTSGSFTGLQPGTYSIAIRNANGTCIILESNPVQLDYPPAPSIVSVDSSQPTDCDVDDGMIIISATDGIGSFEFSINGGSSWQSSGAFSGLPPGAYYIAVRNANGTCSSLETNPVQLDYPPAPSIVSVDSSQPTDCDVDDGTISITAADGIGSFEFSIDGGSSWQSSGTFSGLPPGAYSIAARNGNGTCIIFVPNLVQLDYPPAPSILSVDSSQPTDCDVDDGTIAVTAADGIGSFEFSINGGSSWQTSGSFTGLQSGSYSIAVRNANGTCIIFVPNPVQLDYPPAPSIISVDFSQPADCGVDDGTISITAADGIGSFEFSIDGGTSWLSSGPFSGLPPGNYSIAVRNANGTCIIFEPNPVQLDYPPAPSIVSVNSSQPTDCDIDDGMIIISATDGIGAFDFSIDGGSSWQSQGTFSALPPGTYSVAVRNANGTCLIFEPNPVQLDYPPAPSILSFESLQPTDCNLNDGTITINATDGIGSFEFSIDGGNFWQSQGTFSDLPPGNYSIAVRNANGTCTSFNSELISLAYPTSPQILAVQQQNPSDCGLNDGSLEIQMSNPNVDYLFSINAGQTWEMEPLFVQLGSGVYNVVVTNGDGTCLVDFGLIQLTIPSSPQIDNVQAIPPSDCGITDGSINIQASGGAGSYEYSIDNGNSWSTSPTYTGLSAGVYPVMIRNFDGTCEVSFVSPIVLEEPQAANILDIIYYSPSDCAIADGTLEILIDNDPSTFEFTIDNGANWSSGNTFENLPSGEYWVGVRTIDGSCETFLPDPITLQTPVAPTITNVLMTQPSDCNLNNGSIQIFASSGIGNFEYSIDNGNTWQANNLFQNLSPDTYIIVVRNITGTCPVIHTTSLQLNYPNQPIINNITTTDITDCESSDGGIFIEATSGVSPLQYSIDGGLTWATNPTFTNLTEGDYTIAISNFDGSCPTDFGAPVELIAPLAPEINFTTITDPTDCGLNDGSIFIHASGGAGVYQYSLDGISWWDSNLFSDLSPGSYLPHVRNIDGTCIIFSDSLLLLAPEAPTLNDALVSAPLNCTENSGSIELIAQGTGSLQYSIDGGQSWQNTNLFENLSIGIYQIALANEDGTCIQDFEPITLGGTEVPSIAQVIIANPTDCNFEDGMITIQPEALNGNYLFSIDGGNTWSNQPDFLNLPPGTYTIMISNADTACIVSWNAPIVLQEPAIPVFDTVTTTAPTACTLIDGSITIDLINEEDYYEFSLDQGMSWHTNPVFNNLSSGEYFITVRNHNGNCLTTYPVPVEIANATDVIDLGPIITDLSSCHSNDASISVDYSGQNLEFSIDGGITWQSQPVFTQLAPNSYTLMIADPNNNCFLIHEFPVIIDHYNATIPLELATTNPFECQEDSGSITIHPPTDNSYWFSIDGGLTYQEENTFHYLGPGYYFPTVMSLDSTCNYHHADTLYLELIPDPEISTINTIHPEGCNTPNGQIIIEATSETTIEYSLDQGENWQINNGIFDQLLPGTYSLWIRNEGSPCTIPYPGLIILEALNSDQVEIFLEESICQGESFPIGDQEYMEAGDYNTILLGQNGCDSIINLSLTVNDTFRVAFHENVCPNEFIIVGADTLSTTGFHEIDLVSTYGCDSTIVVNLDVIPTDTTLLTAVICPGETIEVNDSLFTEAGNYYLTEINEFGCSDILHLSLAFIPGPSMDSISVTNPESCETENGTISFWGLSPSVILSIDSGSTWQSLPFFEMLPAGSYHIFLSDTDTGCMTDTIVDLVSISQPQVAYADALAPSYCGAGDGTIVIEPTGNASFLYSIDGGLHWQTESNFDHLDIGQYQILMSTPSLTCFSDTITITLEAPNNFSILVIDTLPPTCTYYIDGHIEVAVNGPGIYEYAWGNGSVEQSISGLGSGHYALTVTDQNSCSDSLAIILTDPPSFFVELPEDQIFLCPGLSITYPIPDSSFYFEWNNGLNTLAINEELTIDQTGIYYFLTENDQGCLFEDSIEVLPLGTFFSPRFLLPSEGLVGESIFGIEVSWPAPDSIHWRINNDEIEVVDTFLNQIELQFLAEGTYSINLEIHHGDCSILIEKEITIYDDPAQLGGQNGNGYSEILEYMLFPNPNTGQFEIRVVLEQAIPVQIRIYRDNGVLMTSRILQGEASYQEAIDLSSAPPGNYIAQLQTASEWKTINFIIQ